MDICVPVFPPEDLIPSHVHGSLADTCSRWMQWCPLTRLFSLSDTPVHSDFAEWQRKVFRFLVKKVKRERFWSLWCENSSLVCGYGELDILRMPWKMEFQETTGPQIINQLTVLLADHHHKTGWHLIKKHIKVFVLELPKQYLINLLECRVIYAVLQLNLSWRFSQALKLHMHKVSWSFMKILW